MYSSIDDIIFDNQMIKNIKSLLYYQFIIEICKLKENWELLNNAEKRQFIVNFIDHIEIVNEMEHRTKGNIKIKNVEFYKD